VLVLIGFFTWYGYFLVQELGPRGATLGKRLVGIRVAARGGGRLTPEAVIARNLLRDIEVFYPLLTLLILLVTSADNNEEVGPLGWVMTGWFTLFLLFPFFNRDALRAGDIVAGTWVVERPRTKLGEALSTQGAAAARRTSDLTGVRYEFGEAELAVYGEKELQTLERMLRDAQPDALSAVHATICRKIGWEPGAGDERAFLEAFYAQLRAKLEGEMRFGKRKADKYGRRTSARSDFMPAMALPRLPISISGWAATGTRNSCSNCGSRKPRVKTDLAILRHSPRHTLGTKEWPLPKSSCLRPGSIPARCPTNCCTMPRSSGCWRRCADTSGSRSPSSRAMWMAECAS
jgi:uncharacterized RDD family membrane protein YckC